MPINPIQSGQGPDPTSSGESKAEQQKIDELEWQINLIATVVSATQQNSPYENQADQLNKAVKQPDTSPESLVPNVNQLIQQVNQSLGTAFPPFELTSSGNEKQALENYVKSLQQYLHKLGGDNLNAILNQTSTLIDKINNGQTSNAINELNQIINAANQIVSPSYQLQTLGKKSL